MKRVLIGMSGGVDSSVAALLLKKEGYEVIGVTMILFEDPNISVGCLSNEVVKDAKKVCEALGIEHHTLELKEEFKCKVIDNFINCYQKGETPNPCVECNKFLKFGALYEKAKELNCEYIATGHYAKIKDGKLTKSKEIHKDQSYFLYGIKKEVLSHIIFPLENFDSKEEIRKIAEENNLIVARKKESQEICFIPNDDYKTFLIDKLKNVKEGNFINSKGEILGKHKGIINYTIGQRKGLGISAKTPLYVISINPETNEVVLGCEEELYKNNLIAKNVNLLVDELPKEAYAKIRFRAKEEKCKIEKIDEETYKVIFEHPVKSITYGQSVVFYKDDICLGGGIISK